MGLWKGALAFAHPLLSDCSWLPHLQNGCENHFKGAGEDGTRALTGPRGSDGGRGVRQVTPWRGVRSTAELSQHTALWFPQPQERSLSAQLFPGCVL